MNIIIDNPKKLFFGADTHFNHKKIIEHDNRPYEIVREMNNDLLDKIHKTIPKDGIYVHCGDITMWDRDVEEFVSKIERNIIHVRGNHDNFDLSHLPNVLYSVDNATLIINDQTLGLGAIQIVCSHYPHLSWDGMFRNNTLDGTIKTLGEANGKQQMKSLHCYGHVHNGFLKDNDVMIQEYLKTALAINVGIMQHDYTPISYERLMNMFNDKLEFINGETLDERYDRQIKYIKSLKGNWFTNLKNKFVKGE